MLISRLITAIVIAGCLFAAAALTASVMAQDDPALDIVNNGLPLLSAGLFVLFAASLAMRSRMLIVTTGALFAVSAAILVPRLSGEAPTAESGQERLLRVLTFNMQGKSELHEKQVEAFFGEANADVVVLEEVRWKHEAFLKRLKKTYPHQWGIHGLVFLSKFPVLDKGRLDRPGEPYWRSLIVNWVQLDIDGKPIDLIGAHMARPFYPKQQKTDFDKLTEFVSSRTAPVIVAGDFNAAPWTDKIQEFTAKTGLQRLNTFRPTWPARWRSLPLIPVLPIDHVFISPQLAKISISTGPRLASDHMPVTADIGLAQ